jgi:dTDP-4-amino-4,6-dideoxygalactose transaminase
MDRGTDVEFSSLALLGGEPVLTGGLAAWPVFDDAEREGLKQVLESGVWGGYSPAVKAFESAFAEAHDCQYGISLANGTLSLEAALLACGVGPGDEVIVPPITFAATATAVLRVGAVPVFSDIEEISFNLDPLLLEEAITPRTRAIIPVHFAGHPANMDELLRISRQHGLIVIEDCAHAHGAAWHGRKVGSFGSFGSFSFQQSKNMTAGEGGILVTNSASLAQKAWSIGNQGRLPTGAWYQHDSLGSNFRLTGFQAAILNAQFARLSGQLARRKENAQRLSSALARTGFFFPPQIAPEADPHAFHLFVVRAGLGSLQGVPKSVLMQAVIAEGVPGISAYPQPIYSNNVFADFPFRKLPCPVAERMCQECFWLSHEVLLADSGGVEKVIRVFDKISRNRQSLLRCAT